MNILNIGMDMSEVLLPQIKMEASAESREDLKLGDNEQINASAVYSYLNMRGVGVADSDKHEEDISRQFNAITTKVGEVPTKKYRWYENGYTKGSRFNSSVWDK